MKTLSTNSSFGHIPCVKYGVVSDVTGTVVEATTPKCEISQMAEIEINRQTNVKAEVIGFRNNKTLLLAYGELNGVHPGSRVRMRGAADSIHVGDHLLGRVVDPFMTPLIGDISKGHHTNRKRWPLDRNPPNPMLRERIRSPLSLGVKAIDGLLTFCEGQRVGIMAGSGVGKSVLMGMIARGGNADVNVIGLIGERGREVREFIEKELGEEGLRKSVVVVATSDQSPLQRIRAAKAVASVAEYFSHQGKKVLVMMDSLSRIAQAQREVGLAAGEPPTTKGYPPSVFSLLPKLLERCGPQPAGNGSISGLFSVLVDGDDFNDPIPDAARSILDGHICLSRTLAEKGHFPSIDVSASVSRLMKDIVSHKQFEIATYLKALMAEHQENFDFVQLGAYQPGTNQRLDQALHFMDKINEFLIQDTSEIHTFDDTLSKMAQVFNLDINEQ